MLIINKDPTNAHDITISFEDGGNQTPGGFTGKVSKATFGAAEYLWHPEGAASRAEPDGPAKRESLGWQPGQKVVLPRASLTVLTGKVTGL